MNEEVRETKELVGRAQGGDPSALNELMARYFPLVVRVAELRLGRKVRGFDAEDVAQEAMIDALRDLHSFRFRSTGEFRNWLARVIENNIRDAQRRGLAMKRGGGCVLRGADMEGSTLSELVFAGGEPTPSQHAMGAELEARLEAALRDGLNEAQREVVLLRNLCGMSYGEIAERMGYSGESSVRSLHCRAIRELGKLL